MAGSDKRNVMQMTSSPSSREQSPLEEHARDDEIVSVRSVHHQPRNKPAMRMDTADLLGTNSSVLSSLPGFLDQLGRANVELEAKQALEERKDRSRKKGGESRRKDGKGATARSRKGLGFELDEEEAERVQHIEIDILTGVLEHQQGDGQGEKGAHGEQLPTPPRGIRIPVPANKRRHSKSALEDESDEEANGQSPQLLRRNIEIPNRATIPSRPGLIKEESERSDDDDTSSSNSSTTSSGSDSEGSDSDSEETATPSTKPVITNRRAKRASSSDEDDNEDEHSPPRRTKRLRTLRVSRLKTGKLIEEIED